MALVVVNIFSWSYHLALRKPYPIGGVSYIFLPLIIASSGNAGSQSATLMIRAMAMGDVHMRDCYACLGKEFLVSSFWG